MQHAPGQALRGVVREHGDAGLQHRGARVELGYHEMHRCTGVAVAGLKRPAMRVQTPVFRQQRRMNVQ